MSFLSIDPIFHVHDWVQARALIAEVVELTKTEEGTLIYTFYENGDALHVSEYYVDAAAAIAHLEHTKDVLGRALSGPCELRAMRVAGPKDQLELVKPFTDPLAAEYFEVLDGGVSNPNATIGVAAAAESFVIFPIFKVNDWDKCDTEFVRPLLAKAPSDAGCLYYDFAKTTNNDRLLCRERYVSANAAVQHLTGVGEILGAATAAGIIEVEYLAVKSNSEGIDSSKEAFDPFAPDYTTVVDGFEKLTLKK